MNARKVVVTGGAGFIGSHLVDRLLTEGFTVLAYDNFDEFYNGKERNISGAQRNRNFSLVRASILDYDSLKKAFDGAEFVFHLAAQPGVRFSFHNPSKTNMTNTEGTLNVIKACLEQKTKRMIYASSSSVYGTPLTTPVGERHPTNPQSVYGASKLAAENYCLIHHTIRFLPVVCLRYHTVYGPRQRPDMAIYKWTSAILKGQPPMIYGDGTQTRDFTSVHDIVNGTLLAANAEAAVGEVFNLASGNTITVNEALAKLEASLKTRAVEAAHEPAKPWDPAVTHADIRKAKQLLGYSPRTSFDEGLRQFAEWVLNQPQTN